MQFHFSLEGLLRVRQLLEDQARERLDRSMMRIASLKRSLEDAQRWCVETAKACALNDKLPAVELQYIASILHRTREAIAQCRQEKQTEEERAGDLRAAYLAARRERETVGTLRENALRQFRMEQSRRQQSELDDHFLGRLSYARRKEQAGSEALPEEM